MKTYMVSWNKPERMFRWRERADEQGMMATEAYGSARAVGTDTDNFRLYMEAEVTEHTPRGLIRLKASPSGIEVPNGATYLGDTKWRCCARRGQHDFRLMNERNRKEAYYVTNFLGDWNLVWDDRGSHLFHQGKAYLDEANRTIYLVP